MRIRGGRNKYVSKCKYKNKCYTHDCNYWILVTRVIFRNKWKTTKKMGYKSAICPSYFHELCRSVELKSSHRKSG